MKEMIYFPGCTLKTTAKPLEDSALKVAEALGMEIKEMPQWYCCGTVYSLAQDDLIKQLASIRNLILVQTLGHNEIMTLCSMCYNTLAQSNLLVRKDEKKLQKINQFISEQPDYKGEIEVKHFLTLLKKVGTEKIKEVVKNGLSGLRIACYYGCLLLRPKEVGIDNYEQPTILEELMEALGAKPVYFPYKTECCGSYHTAIKPEIVARRVYHILENARENGAELVVTSCPLCYFNLKDRQKNIKKIYPDFKKIPVRYFTEIMSQALGV
ncbi:8-methylmenaquinol:fumarate reductase membrane anchor subunit [Candidatus Methanoperedenaceae archaeon GB50]|nr:8-methylmenaquinol:fumarate reductase membrane anchor subunit [Candidatus Methanoperedenaceae archaeon GB50]